MRFRVQRVHLLVVVQAAIIVLLLGLQLLGDTRDAATPTLKPLHLAAHVPPPVAATGPRADAELSGAAAAAAPCASCAPCKAPQAAPSCKPPPPAQPPPPPPARRSEPAPGSLAPGPGPFRVDTSTGRLSVHTPYPVSFNDVAVGIVTDGGRFAPNADRFYHEWGHAFPHVFYAADFEREPAPAGVPHTALEHRPRVLKVEGSSIAERLLTMVRPLLEAAPSHVNWFVIADDDTALFPENLLDALGQYDPSYPWYIGALSEDVTSLFRHGHAAYGGAGYVLSRPLMHAFAYARGMDAGVACLALMRDKNVFAGDEATGICLANLGVTVTLHPGFHQMDMKGDLSPLVQLLYGHDPLISLHHLYTCKPLFSRFLLDAAAKPASADAHEEDARWAALRHWYASYRSHPHTSFNLLQYEPVPELGLSLAWNLGTSIRLYAGMYPASHYTGRYLPFVYSAWGGGYINFDLLPSGGVSEQELCAGAYFEWARPLTRVPPPPGSLTSGTPGDWHVYTREWRRDFCRPLAPASTHGALQRVLVRVEPCLLRKHEPTHSRLNASLVFADGAGWSGLLPTRSAASSHPPPPVTRALPSRARVLTLAQLRSALLWVVKEAVPALLPGKELGAAAAAIAAESGGGARPALPGLDSAAWERLVTRLTEAASAAVPPSGLDFAGPLLARGTLGPDGTWAATPTAATPGTPEAVALTGEAALADVLGLISLVPVAALGDVAAAAAAAAGGASWWVAVVSATSAVPGAGSSHPVTSIPLPGNAAKLVDTDHVLLLWSSTCPSRPAAVRQYPIVPHASYYIPQSFRPF